MGWFDWLRGKSQGEQFAQWSIADQAFAAWLRGEDLDSTQEAVTPYTVLGLSAVLRSVSVISTTIASLPLRTYERQGDERVRIPSVFDDPYPGIEGLTPFAWHETVLIHLLLYRHAFLWHETRAADGTVTSYRPLLPSAIEKVERVNGKRRFTYTDAETHEKREVGSEALTYIPGPSLDGVVGHPLLHAARSVFSAAISGDKTAQLTLRRGIRLAGIVTPADKEEEIDETDGKAILEQLRSTMVGREHAGDLALINRRVKVENYGLSNIESQWAETREQMLGEVGRLFGVPPHLLNDIEKQTSWGTGVAEQNLGFARYTLMGWTSRIEQVLTQRLPRDQFVEFDYTGLLQGTPADEIELLLKQIGDKPFLTVEEARKIRNLPPLTPEQRAELTPPESALNALRRQRLQQETSVRQEGAA